MVVNGWLLLVIVLGVFICAYILTRLIAIAYFRTKLEHFKGILKATREDTE